MGRKVDITGLVSNTLTLGGKLKIDGSSPTVLRTISMPDFDIDLGNFTNYDSAYTHSTSDGSDHLDVSDLVSLSGVVANSGDLGAFTGSTLGDTETIKSALQSLEGAIEGVNVDASGFTFTPTVLADWDSGIDPGNLDDAVDQLASRLETAEGGLTAHSTGDGSDHQDVVDLSSLSGVSPNATNLGTFSGSVIQDSATIKVAIQDLENHTPKNNFVAIIDPIVLNDSSQGYTTGSEWTNTNNESAWICMDASTGAAVWRLITQDVGLLDRILTANGEVLVDETGNVVYS